MAPVGEPGVRARAVDVRISVYQPKRFSSISAIVTPPRSSGPSDRNVPQWVSTRTGVKPERTPDEVSRA